MRNQSFRDQWRHLVFSPLSRLEVSSSLSSYVLIVDALDECDNVDHIRMILQLLAEVRLLKNSTASAESQADQRFQSDTVFARFLMLSATTSSSII